MTCCSLKKIFVSLSLAVFLCALAGVWLRVVFLRQNESPETVLEAENQNMSSKPDSLSYLPEGYFEVSSMSEADLELARQQMYCPVTLLEFINMNVGGIRVRVRGRDVMVASNWAKEKLIASPGQYFEILDAWERERRFNQKVHDALSTLSAEDRILVKEQSLCLVDNQLLGLNGSPIKIVIQSARVNLRKLIKPRTETIFVCCGKCKEKVLEAPEQYFVLLDIQRKKSETRKHLSAFDIFQIEKSFESLSSEDRTLAEEQLICPVSKIRLGTFGLGSPIRVEVDGSTVMICCEGCRKELLSYPRKYFRALRNHHFKALKQSLVASKKISRSFDLPRMELPKEKLPQMELPKEKLPQMELPK